MTLKITERLVGDVTILDLDGRITLGEGSRCLRDTIKKVISEGKKKILVDLADIAYIDSSGNGEMVSAYTYVRNGGGILKLLNPSKKYHDLLQITKLFTVYEVFDDEKIALASFGSHPMRCKCPLCGAPSGPPNVNRTLGWSPQVCTNSRCECKFNIDSSASTKGEELVKSIRVQSYIDEYAEILPGSPYVIRIVGRLNLFSSSALQRAWSALPKPRRVMIDMREATEVDAAGRRALLALLAGLEADARVVVSLEGLALEQVSAFPCAPPFYAKEASALAALGDISSVRSWPVSIVNE